MKIKTKNLINAVLFDFGGVIAEEGFREGLRLIAKKSNVEPDLFNIISGMIRQPPDKILFVDDYMGHIERANKKGFHTHLFIDQDGFMEDMRKIFIVE